MQAEVFLTSKLQQRLSADPRRIVLLRQTDQTGPMSQRAKHAGISYKSAWDATNETNQLSEQPLVDRTTGDKGGGSAMLTRYGQWLIQLYDLLAQIQQKAFDVLNDDDALSLDSLLTAISRFPLQISARSQWFGTITGRDCQQVQQRVEVLLVDGQTRLTVAVTAQGTEKLGSGEGQEVLVPLKAPWVDTTLDPTVARRVDNQLSGRISHIECGSGQCEVLVTLVDGQTLCATLPQTQTPGLAEGTEAIVYFNTDRIILATLY